MCDLLVTFIRSRKGHPLLYVDNHTFTKTREYPDGTIQWKCCKMYCNVKARIRHGRIIEVGQGHDHDPPKVILVNNRYIKI